MPSSAPPGFHIGRIVSGTAWPPHLDPIDRLAAIPSLGSDRLAREVDERDVVLGFESSCGRRTPICARASADRTVWSFDPADWIRGLLAEAYVATWKRPLPSRLPGVNYSRAPHWLKGLLEGVQSPRAEDGGRARGFPGLPFDSLVDRVRALCAALACGAPPAPAALWPGGRRAAVTVTHDVDTSWILDRKRSSLLGRMLEGEASLGFKGAWYVVADRVRSAAHEAALRAIRGAWHEIGAHGWNHDAKLEFLSASGQEWRMRRIGERLAGAGIEGIRTPWYCRSPRLFEVLSRHFGYDSSVPNASGFFSSGGHSGCCTAFPYEPRAGFSELPMTLPPDTALAPGARAGALRKIADEVIALGGVVVVTLHPQPHQSGNAAGLRAHLAFLEQLVEDYGEALWHATPRQIVARYRGALAEGQLTR